MKRYLPSLLVLVPFTAVTTSACGGNKPAPADAATATAPAPTTTPATATQAPASDAGATAPEGDAAATGSGNSNPADAATTAPTPPAPGDGCVPATSFEPLSKLAPDHASFAKGVVTLCGPTAGGAANWCFTLDLAQPGASGAQQPEDDLAHLPNAVGAVDDPFRRKDDAPALQLCLDAATGCKDVFVGQTLAATLSEDKKRFVLATLDDREKRVRVFDTTSHAETSSVLVEKDADLPDCTFGALVGESLLVSTGPCGDASSGHRAWLANAASGEKMADIGGVADFDLRYGGFVHVKDDLWAFRAADGSKVVVQDVKTGAVQATADLSAAGARGSLASWLFVTAEPLELVVVENRPVAGAVYAFDPLTGKATRSLVPKACP